MGTSSVSGVGVLCSIASVSVEVRLDSSKSFSPLDSSTASFMIVSSSPFIVTVDASDEVLLIPDNSGELLGPLIATMGDVLEEDSLDCTRGNTEFIPVNEELRMILSVESSSTNAIFVDLWYPKKTAVISLLVIF